MGGNSPDGNSPGGNSPGRNLLGGDTCSKQNTLSKKHFPKDFLNQGRTRQGGSTIWSQVSSLQAMHSFIILSCI